MSSLLISNVGRTKVGSKRRRSDMEIQAVSGAQVAGGATGIARPVDNPDEGRHVGSIPPMDMHRYGLKRQQKDGDVLSEASNLFMDAQQNVLDGFVDAKPGLDPDVN